MKCRYCDRDAGGKGAYCCMGQAENGRIKAEAERDALEVALREIVENVDMSPSGASIRLSAPHSTAVIVKLTSDPSSSVTVMSPVAPLPFTLMLDMRTQ